MSSVYYISGMQSQKLKIQMLLLHIKIWLECKSIQELDSLSIIAAPHFPDGKTYVYKYEAVLMGGLPEEGLARTGLKILSKVSISRLAEDSFILKVKSLNNSFQHW